MVDKLYPLLKLPQIPADTTRKDIGKLEYFFLQEHFGWSAVGWWTTRMIVCMLIGLIWCAVNMAILQLLLMFWLKYGKKWWETLRKFLKVEEAKVVLKKWWESSIRVLATGIRELRRVWREWWKGKAKNEEVNGSSGNGQERIEMTNLTPTTPMVI